MVPKEKEETTNAIVRAEFSSKDRDGSCSFMRWFTGHRKVCAYRPLIYRPDNFEKDAVEVRFVITTEPKLFKGLGYEDFNEYLRKHYIITGADPLTSRLKSKEHAEPGVNSGAASPKGSSKTDAPSQETTATVSSDLYGIEKLEVDGHEKVTPLQIALQLVGQVQSSGYFVRPEHFIVRVAEETTSLFKRLMGQHVGGSKQWKAFQASAKANNDIQFIVNVYVDAFQYFPRHCCTSCNIKDDALECCWEEKFGYSVFQSDSRLRLATMIHMLRCDLTNAICTFLENEGLRVVDYPDYVHMVMEQWIASAHDDEIAGLPPVDTYREACNYSLVEKTGLPLTQVKKYKDRYKSFKYSFETRQDQRRISKFDGCEKASGMTKYAVVIPCVRRYPRKLFQDLPKTVQRLILRKVRMFSSIEDKRLHIWYNRIRRTEVELAERKREEMPLYYSVGFSRF